MSAPYTSIGPTGASRSVPIRALFDRYARSPLGSNIWESDGIAIGAWYPHRYLPVQWIDIKTQEGVVINKGDIVSIAGPTVSLSGGMTLPSENGNLYTFFSANDNTIQSGSMWDSIRGYNSDMGGVMVPANGGRNSTPYYTDADVRLGTLTPSGTLAAAGSGITWQVPANRPVGVAREDVYQDNRARYLNGIIAGYSYKGILCDAYIKIPYVDVVKFNDVKWSGILHAEDWTFGSGVSARTPMTESGAYADVARHHSFLYTISGVNDGGLHPGGLVTSDDYGKWIPQYNGTTNTITGSFPVSGFITASGDYTYGSGDVAVASGDETIAEYWVSGAIPLVIDSGEFAGSIPISFTMPNAVTEQTVGRIVEFVNAFPHDMLDSVDTYPTTDAYNKMPGTATGGLPQELFTFAYDAVYYGSSGTITPSPAVLVEAVRSGVFGMARIQVMVA